MNLGTLRSNSLWDEFGKLNKEDVFLFAEIKVGQVHNQHQKANNPTIAPYFGEIPYSGRQQVLGYYGNKMNNPIFNQYLDAAMYGNKN